MIKTDKRIEGLNNLKTVKESECLIKDLLTEGTLGSHCSPSFVSYWTFAAIKAKNSINIHLLIAYVLHSPEIRKSYV